MLRFPKTDITEYIGMRLSLKFLKPSLLNSKLMPPWLFAWKWECDSFNFRNPDIALIYTKSIFYFVRIMALWSTSVRAWLEPRFYTTSITKIMLKNFNSSMTTQAVLIIAWNGCGKRMVILVAKHALIKMLYFFK